MGGEGNSWFALNVVLTRKKDVCCSLGKGRSGLIEASIGMNERKDSYNGFTWRASRP